MSNIIVVGCGRVGSRLALMLSNYENNVCVIDRDPRALCFARARFQWRYVRWCRLRRRRAHESRHR